METIELRNKLVDIIKSSDERFLCMVSLLHKSYIEKLEADFFTELPAEVQELLNESFIEKLEYGIIQGKVSA